MSQTPYPTTVLKSNYGWEAYTDVELEDWSTLRIHTMKHHTGGLQTTATRMVRSPTEDFYIVVIQQRGPVTEHAVRSQHDTALEQIEDLKVRVKAHHAALDERNAEQNAAYA